MFINQCFAVFSGLHFKAVTPTYEHPNLRFNINKLVTLDINTGQVQSITSPRALDNPCDVSQWLENIIYGVFLIVWLHNNDSLNLNLSSFNDAAVSRPGIESKSSTNTN